MDDSEMRRLAQERLRDKALERRRRERYVAEMAADPHDPRHGTKRGYLYGCRCKECTRANTEKNREYRKMKKEERAN